MSWLIVPPGGNALPGSGEPHEVVAALGQDDREQPFELLLKTIVATCPGTARNRPSR